PSLTVSGEVTLAGTPSVEIVNTTLTVAGDVEITNTSLTVAGEMEITNPSLTVSGEVTLAGTPSVEIVNTTLTVAGDVEITNTSLTISGDIAIAGHEIAETNTTLNDVTGTGTVFDDTDISQTTTGSFFVYNTGSNSFTISLQVSPTTDDDLYALDVDNDDLPVPVNAKLILAISKYGRYARLLYDAGAGASFSAYYIGQM
ncbi:MAG TPA: DUF6385 domain-containing protein, partial [Syntrophomonas sp.]|nr:DUF6385 domain-containing protein [Syntrophomonas sp.]